VQAAAGVIFGQVRGRFRFGFGLVVNSDHLSPAAYAGQRLCDQTTSTCDQIPSVRRISLEPRARPTLRRATKLTADRVQFITNSAPRVTPT